MKNLLLEIRSCRLCKKYLDPRPVVQAASEARIAIVGQAPGRKVHESGIPWDDASGRNLRSWLGMDEGVFYDPAKVALIPMGFCYPGKGKSGDLPPRTECAPAWHASLFEKLPELRLTILVGRYAQDYYLDDPGETLTETVRNYGKCLPAYFPLVHPSPRNGIWMKKNPWFGLEVLPALKTAVAEALS